MKARPISPAHIVATFIVMAFFFLSPLNTLSLANSSTDGPCIRDGKDGSGISNGKKFTEHHTGRLLILLLGLNTKSDEWGRWSNIESKLSELYDGIVYFSYNNQYGYPHYRRVTSPTTIT